MHTNRITEKRLERNMTVAELADRSGLSAAYVSRMATGGRNVSLKNLAKLAKALGCRSEDLISGEIGETDDDHYSDIGQAIQRRRKALGLTQEDLAKRLNTSGATVNRWEGGRRGIKADHLQEIASALQTTAAELFGLWQGAPSEDGAHDIDPLLLAAWKRLNRRSRKQLVQFALIMAGDGN
jgi:transcriptional regulator with XRE-family HTH domain